jgi:predicted alternative tryptophan synthase beta-subunit
VDQLRTFEAAINFALAEGILPAPERAHAVRASMDKALKCKAEGKRRVIAFNLSGHGLLDLAAYDALLQGQLQNYDFPEERIQEALQKLPSVALSS